MDRNGNVGGESFVIHLSYGARTIGNREDNHRGGYRYLIQPRITLRAYVRCN